MTWPTCPNCAGAYIPIHTLDGCPWCIPDPRIAQRETARLTKIRAANQRAEAKRLARRQEATP